MFRYQQNELADGVEINFLIPFIIHRDFGFPDVAVVAGDGRLATLPIGQLLRWVSLSLAKTTSSIQLSSRVLYHSISILSGGSEDTRVSTEARIDRLDTVSFFTGDERTGTAEQICQEEDRVDAFSW